MMLPPSYTRVAAQLRERMNSLLASGQDTALGEPNETCDTWDVVTQAVYVAKLMDYSPGPALDSLVHEILVNPRLSEKTKLLVAERYGALEDRSKTGWIWDYIRLVSTSDPVSLRLLIRLCLWLRRFAEAKALLETARAMDSADLTEELAGQAKAWKSRGGPRTAAFCWHILGRHRKLDVLQALDACLLLLHAGRIRGAGTMLENVDLNALPSSSIPLLHLTFARKLINDRLPGSAIEGPCVSTEKRSLAYLCEQALAGAASDVTILRVFSPYSVELFHRLDLSPVRKGDLRLAAAYAEMFLAEDRAGRLSSVDILLAGKYMLAAGWADQALEMMERRSAADPGFVDGYASLSVYAGCAGKRDLAEHSLALEPMDRPRAPLGWFRLALAAALLGDAMKVESMLQRLSDQAPDYFSTWTSTAGSWGMLSLLFRLTSREQASDQAALVAAHDPYWKYRKHLLERFEIIRQPTRFPAFAWPNPLAGALNEKG